MIFSPLQPIGAGAGLKPILGQKTVMVLLILITAGAAPAVAPDSQGQALLCQYKKSHCPKKHPSPGSGSPRQLQAGIRHTVLPGNIL